MSRRHNRSLRSLPWTRHPPRTVSFARTRVVACLLALLACDPSESAEQTDPVDEDAGAIARDCDPSREFRCGDGTCIAPDRWCDGVVDCANRRDEASCEEGCGSGQVICENRECIAPSEVCDGAANCSDASDERNCPEAMCEGLPRAIPGYQGTVSFTRQQFSQCEAFCGQRDDCYNDLYCPGIESFNECLRVETLACSGKERGDCRVDYESFACCALERCANDAFCERQMCAFEAAVLKACLPKDYTCVSSASARCFAPGP